MKRTSKSITYETGSSIIDQLFTKRDLRDLWLFEYISRHIHEGFGQKIGDEERVQAFDQLLILLEANQALAENEAEAIHQLLTFSYGLVYALHKQKYSDGLIDPLMDSQISHFNSVLQSLTAEELSFVEELHQLTHEYGFLITELWLPPTGMKDLAFAFIKSQGDRPEVPLPIPRFSFTRKGKFVQGIQIAVSPYEAVIKDTWDLAVFFSDGEKISHLKSKLHDVWNTEGIKSIGDGENYKIALYVNRKSCTESHVLSVLNLQIEHLILKGVSPKKKGIKSPLSSYIDQIRLSENFLSKRWSTRKDNIRRAIGLYLWDEVNVSNLAKKTRKSVVEDCIELLKREAPAALEQYFSRFNEPASQDKSGKLGDQSAHYQTVIREMEADYDLTEYCISMADYHIPNDAKNKK